MYLYLFYILIEIASDSGPTAGIAFGCIFSLSMMIISVILFIYELFRPDPVYPVPSQPHDNDLGNEYIGWSATISMKKRGSLQI